MRTGLKKSEKDTYIYFNEVSGAPVEISTHNTALKRRLRDFAEKYPDECRFKGMDEDTGCMYFDINKGRFSVRLTAPYSAERRSRSSAWAKEHGIGKAQD